MQSRKEGGSFKEARSFKVQTIADQLDKLEWEIQQLASCQVRADAMAVSYHSINAAITAWHVVDWIFVCASQDQKDQWVSTAPSGGGPATRFGKLLKGRERALSLCQEIANSSKHLELTSFWEPQVKAGPPASVTVFARAGNMRAGDAIASHSSIAMIQDGDHNHPAVQVFTRAGDFLWEFARSHGLLDLPG